MKEQKSQNLMIAVVQSQDADLVDQNLTSQGFVFVRLPSTGGFLRDRNVTFMIASSPETVEGLKEMLLSVAKKRITYIATPIESGPLPIPIPTETVVGGVSLFGLEVEHFEEI
jgi:uncharacterized protein YaaQ